MRTAKNILQHELIGMMVEVTHSPLPRSSGVHGIIIDETRNTIVIEHDDKDITIPKQGTKMKFNLPADENRPESLIDIEIDGEQLIARPEDRVKKNEARARRK